MKNLVILGSTGSIGTQVLEIVKNQNKKYTIAALTTHSNLELFKKQIKKFNPEIVSVWEENKALELKEWIHRQQLKVKVFYGINGLIEAATYSKANLIVSSVVGAIGLEPLLAAINCKKNIALANKESLVVAGDLIMSQARKKNVHIIPVDSEHSAIFQCIKNENKAAIKRVLITASGGPFYKSKKDFSKITVEDALAHPTWVMGKKITVDSATLMNKGLEAIEAHHLFDIPYEKIDILIHPQSIVHSLVEFVDGSVLAQLSKPDMRLPIQYALSYPERNVSQVQQLDLTKIKRLDFDSPDFDRFQCLNLALKAGIAGGTLPVAMNAANEVAVHSFLDKKLNFADIPFIIEKVMSSHKINKNPSLKEILTVDLQSRKETKDLIIARCL